MHVAYLLFLGLLLSSFWLTPKMAFVKNAGLSVVETRILLALKMISGLACAYYFKHVFAESDQVIYNNEGLAQYQVLLSNPITFFTDFKHDIQQYGFGGIFDSSHSFWAYLRFNLLYKFIAVMNLATRGNFYLNSVLFSSIVFFGNIAFYRIYIDMYRPHKLKVLVSCFLLPSLLLYTSCVHKDGLVFLCIGIISFILYSFLKNGRMGKAKAYPVLAICIFTIFLFRNYVLVALLPAMFTALLAKRLPYRLIVIYAASYSLFCLLFFVSGHINSSFSLPNAVIKRKADFAALEKGNTDVPMNDLYPTLTSFLQNVPQALNHALFRPYLWEFPGTGVILTAIELLFYQIIIIGFVFFRNKGETGANNFNLFGLAFFVSMMLIIGYTIPNIGAIVRYRSIFWIFLVCPLWCNVKWPKLKWLGK